MHLHILGLSGTFMSALALLARELGFTVTGSDTNCYPPISDLLASQGITWTDGYEESTDALQADCVIVGNAIKRKMPVMEAVMNAGKNYISGPQWLAENVLPRYRVIAVAGTHGKTTTTSMLAYILHYAGLKPGFLIGGVASDFKTSACLGKGEWFVIEADEYDSAFFDKRPKFMHYRPEVAILNNLEFDHADIYPNLAAIQQQFHYFLKTIPSNGLVIKPRDDSSLNEVLAQGQFSRVAEIALTGSADWRAELLDERGGSFIVKYQGQCVSTVTWSLIGEFNVENGLAAIAASFEAGVDPTLAAAALAKFTPVKRRLEVKFQAHGVTVYDDFAHHPTAIAKTIQALKNSQRHKRVLVILEFASFTMRSGVHAGSIEQALDKADAVFFLAPQEFTLELKSKHVMWSQYSHIGDLVSAALRYLRPGDGIVVMSNRGFDNIQDKLRLGIEQMFMKNEVFLK